MLSFSREGLIAVNVWSHGLRKPVAILTYSDHEQEIVDHMDPAVVQDVKVLYQKLSVNTPAFYKRGMKPTPTLCLHEHVFDAIISI